MAEAQPLVIEIGNTRLAGTLGVPNDPRGLVLFAHGSGSSRHSPRNRFVADTLQGDGFATLLLDLLTLEEERLDARTPHLRFDIPLLAQRLSGATDWMRHDDRMPDLPIGYFGASTGAAAALIAAAARSDVSAVVSRGGRPDLAGAALGHVSAPTLLIVGGADVPLIALNRRALARLGALPRPQAPARLEIVPDASHLFEEPGALEEVARLAGQWFAWHLGARDVMRRAG